MSILSLQCESLYLSILSLYWNLFALVCVLAVALSEAGAELVLAGSVSACQLPPAPRLIHSPSVVAVGLPGEHKNGTCLQLAGALDFVIGRSR